jgi:hypothetical protein
VSCRTQDHRLHLIASKADSLASSYHTSTFSPSNRDSSDTHHPRYGNYGRVGDGRNSWVGDMEMCMVEVAYHKAEALEELFVRNCMRCPQRWPLCNCCKGLYGTSQDKYGCHISKDAHKSWCRYVPLQYLRLFFPPCPGV